MCYHCATNPSIHHHHCCCCSVAFIITLLWFCCCCHGVAFMSVMVLSSLSQCHLCVSHGFIVAVAVSPSHQSQFCCCHHGVAFVVASLQCHLCHHIIAVLPSSLHCCGFIIIAVLPSSLHCCGVVITVASLWC